MSDMQMKSTMHRVLVILCSLYGLIMVSSENLEIEVTDHCIEQCPLQNRTESSNLGCQQDCSINQCTEGCKLWKRALVISCSRACNSTEHQNPPSGAELFCTMGCNNAITWYFNRLRQKLGTPPAPTLVAGSLSPTSLKLEWNFPEAKELGLTYLVQWRYEELAGNWEYSGNQTWGPYNTVTVEKLLPYTKYRFRVALMLSQQQEPIVSAPSVVISTLPAGVPTSSPIIVRAVPIDSTRISVSWEPGPFPNGPILSYLLRITENAPQGYSALENISTEKGTSFIFGNLKPNTNYNISISMRNGVGSGPTEQTTVSTPQKPKVERSQKPLLVISGNHVVIQRGDRMWDEVKILFETPNNEEIKGSAIHVSKQLLFVSVWSRTSERIYQMPLSEYGKKQKVIILSTETQIHFKPQDLSMDWLNNQLYILGEMSHPKKTWQVTRCDLDGKNIQVAVAGLQHKPQHIEVDPYNGFLFWLFHGGLYRLDLSDISNGIRHEDQPQRILHRPYLGAFTVDHINFRLLVANEVESNVISVSLDGKEIQKINKTITRSALQKVVSFATANKLFYWTNGEDVFYEEYQNTTGIYFHNTLPGVRGRKYHNLIINLPNSQPIPVPVNPPTSLQAIFGKDLAKATWQAPHLIGGQGKGAWQNWTYEISVKNMLTGKIQTFADINTTAYTIQNLIPGTEYAIKVAAYTKSGPGSWSTEFKARTLRAKNNKSPSIFWSASEGVFISNATGENVENLLPQSQFKSYYFTDIEWYKDQLYMVTNSSKLFLYNLTGRQGSYLINVESVSSVAVDWIGKKLYWSSPKQQVIIRGDLDGSHQEQLPILIIAKELSIDPVRAYLYWSTGQEVECARLNGDDRYIYHHAQLFSGKQVMGITLDFDHNHIYWIVRDSEGSNLYQAMMADETEIFKQLTPKTFNLKKPYMQGPLCYFDNRLLWLQDDRNAIISDLNSNNMAGLRGKSLYGLTTLTVMDSDLQQWPNTSSEGLNVIPDQIDKNSIKIVGSWDFFNITWDAVKNVNYGTVNYYILVHTSSNNIGESFSKPEVQMNTKHPSIKFWKTIMPFTKLTITLRAYTYWGISPITTAEMYSPPSTPSAPTNLRGYICYENHQFGKRNISATFRWDAPLEPNGIIMRYIIKCWYKEEDQKIDICENAFGDSNKKEFLLGNLLEGQIYYFQVQALTEAGVGTPSLPISVNTSYESPLPKLLISSEDSIFVQDIDNNQNYSLIHGISTPVEMAYLMKEKKLFWINKMQELFMFNLENLIRNKLADLNGTCVSLTVDWLERSLYYLENSNDEGSTVYKMNLNHADRGISRIEKILKSSNSILKIEVSPFTRKLYWVEKNQNGEHHLMQSNINGSKIRPFFIKRTHNKRALEEDDQSNCNCPIHPKVEETFTIDHSGSKIKPNVIFVDSDMHSILSSDKDGCHCEVLANHNVVGESSPLQKLKSDFGTLYWINKTQGHLYLLKRNEANVTKKQEISKAYDVQIYGSHMQPYPESKCLVPMYDENLKVLLINKTSHSLVLAMPNVSFHEQCQSISQATVEYSILYKQYSNNSSNECSENCSEVKTLDNIVEVSGLKPFTQYIVWVSINNYFMNLMKNKPHMGLPVVLQTSAGAPSKPRNLTTIVLNPNIVRVSWAPPEELNGEYVWYEIHWQTENTHGIRQKGEQVVINLEKSEENDEYFTRYLSKLSPNETYSIWIRAYSQTNDTYNDSDSVIIKTFPEPSDINLQNATATTLQLFWNAYTYAETYGIQYSPLTSNNWTEISHDKIVYTNVNKMAVTVDGLKPKMQYKFRMKLQYPLYHEPHYWPHDVRFIFETLGDKPSPPGKPYIQLKADKFMVMWDVPKDNGAPIELYKLETMKLLYFEQRQKRSTDFNKASIEEFNYNWTAVYNGTEPSWDITDLEEKNHKYIFRALALNTYGWSDPSNESDMFDPIEFAKLKKQDPMSLIIIATTVPLAFCIVFIICFVCCKLQCTKKKKTKQLILSPRPDVELATLRELPRRGVHSTNILYVPNQPLSDDITMLPHIRRECITLTKFLGSGAFGEVFEGKARGILANAAEIKVAVKALRKGASDQEKCEFLQEAQLMSHFKHEHILQLLGVCLDNDPQFIIMELMQGGDLLTYLRSSRNPSSSTPSLSLLELLKMCVDVAKGCKYLEEMHFVHRDLACRNCLVSSTSRESRIVKIGDFGLARDIYKNDYYRKEGEGLLPVRWMAPESLVDGVFTSQSDVWAFGVLLWEIMTLGQQPYPARTNLEVLHYVKSGGRLGKPVHCPETLHDLMLKCWSYEPERRPTFKFCLYVLEDLHVQMSNDPVTGAHEGQYISTVEERSSWKSGSDGDLSKERTPFLQAKNDHVSSTNSQDSKVPKYLELLCDSDSQIEDKNHLDNDGYEIPRSSFQNTTTTKESKNNNTKEIETASTTEKGNNTLNANNEITAS